MKCCEETYKQTIKEVIQLIDDKKIVSIKHLKIILNFVLEKLEEEHERTRRQRTSE